MHKQRLYIDDYVYDYVTAFGDFNTVVNNCVAMAMDKPDMWLQTDVNEPRGTHCKQRIAYIDNEEYDEYREQMGRHSPYVSIRRLLYYITIYELLSEEELNEDVRLTKDKRRLIKLTSIWSDLVELTNAWNNPCQEQMLEACSVLQEVVDELTMQQTIN